MLLKYDGFFFNFQKKGLYTRYIFDKIYIKPKRYTSCERKLSNKTDVENIHRYSMVVYGE